MFRVRDREDEAREKEVQSRGRLIAGSSVVSDQGDPLSMMRYSKTDHNATFDINRQLL